jgi:hypothetical protein
MRRERRRSPNRHPEVVMNDWSPLEEDVFLKGTLLIRVTGRKDHRPRAGKHVLVGGCGFV